MYPWAEFFQTNHDIVYFIYGEAFFVLGFAVALQSRKHSQLALAQRLWLLAAFGIIHAIYEWGAVFIPIQRSYLPLGIITILQIMQLVLAAVSFLALFQFGVELVGSRLRSLEWLKILPTAVFILWGALTALLESGSGTTLDQTLVLGEVIVRYALAVPGSLAAALGLWLQAQQVRGMDLPRISRYFRFAGFAFLAYAVLSAIVPHAPFFPASVLNYDRVLAVIGVPVPVFRAIAGTVTAYCIIRGMEIFDIETDRMLEEVAQARAVTSDRERIGRELHDSIIQSLYASGLMLEDAALTVDEDTSKAKVKIQGVIDALNRTIRDIRRYILDLRGESGGDWQESLGELVRAFHLETLVDAELHVTGTRRVVLTREEGEHLLTIAREALTNISKHAVATRVDVTLAYRPTELELDIVDNGVGLERNGRGAPNNHGDHQGLRNMQERAQIIGGRLDIENAPKRGTRVRLVVPSTRQG